LSAILERPEVTAVCLFGDPKLLVQNEYLAAENRIIHQGAVERSSEALGRGVLGEIDHRLGRQVVADVATIAQPDTILGWYRKLIAVPPAVSGTPG
jgi:hypothetical protein